MDPAPEPTALACLALTAHRRGSEKVATGLEFLTHLQTPSGAIPTTTRTPLATWPTALALIAWSSDRAGSTSQFEAHRQRALDSILDVRGLTFASDPRIYGHNTQLSAWPWIEGTHTWVEPTAYVMIALRIAHYSDHPRFQEAVEVLRDRAIAGGGWNYGNPKMFGAALRPFIATTGLGLVALAEQPRDEIIDDAISHLQKELPSVRAPTSLAWGVLGLSAWQERPAQADNWLAESAGRVLAGDCRPAEEALLLLAMQRDNVFMELMAKGKDIEVSHA
jgi:hypothetical protein